MKSAKPDMKEHAEIAPFRCRWLTRQFFLCVLMGFGVLLCALLNRLYWANPWDGWTMMGVQAAFWRKPVAVALLSASVWGVSLSLGCLMWWLAFRSFGAKWRCAAGLQSVWAGWANAGMGAWVILLSTTAILSAALFSWKDSGSSDAGIPWFDPQTFTVRQGCYLLIICVLAMIAGNCRQTGGSTHLGGGKAKGVQVYASICLPVTVAMAYLMGGDWLGGLGVGGVSVIAVVYFVVCTVVAGLALSITTGGRCVCEGRAGMVLLAALLVKGGVVALLPGSLAGCCFKWGGLLLLPVLLLVFPAVRRSRVCLVVVGVWVVCGTAIELFMLFALLAGMDLADSKLLMSFGAGWVATAILLAMGFISFMCRDDRFSMESDKKDR